MASVLTDFTKKREFLVCMDSDGCVMDTVSIKHTIVMCPELIRVFALDDHADFVASAWEEINLRNITRGLSRFESVVLVFDRLKNRGIEVPGSEDISAWVNTSAELSTASLQHELLRTGSLALRKLQEWNNACNRRIQALEPTFEPFPGVEESLRQLHAVADLAVVSAANESAIASEWKHYGLARHADVIFGQEVGSKANSIATMLACGYESRKVLMVGDSMGDAQAAAANGVAFVPILPGREADSWRRLQEEALPKLLHGKKVDRLYSIPGKVPNPVDMPDYCYFKDRCEMQLPCCSGEYPCEISLSPTHKVSCYRYYEENRKAGE